MIRVMPDPEQVRRHNALFDHTTAWAAEHPGEDPDDDLEYVAQARQIMGLPPLEPEVTRAAGRDVTPGNDQLHHYWTRGEGLAKWRFSPHPWTTLVGLLTEHVGSHRAKVFASKWFKEVFGYWSGERKGDNPVGPG